MNRFGKWKRIYRSNESSEHVEAQVDDELRHHIEELLERYRSQGMGEDEARVEIARRFPDVEITRNNLVGSTGRSVQNRRRRLFLDDLRSDLRVSLRQFRRRPGFTALAVLTLGLGIGASTILFSVVNGVLLRPLPYPESERLVFIGGCHSQNPMNIRGCTAPEYHALRTSTRTMENLTASRSSTMIISSEHQQPTLVTAASVSEDFFAVFRTFPVLGRAFTDDDFQSEVPRVVILSHRIWQERWAGDPEIIGSTLSTSIERFSENLACTIIGVMPPGFRMPVVMEDYYTERSSTELWMPLRVSESSSLSAWGSFNLRVISRLKPECTVESARSEAVALASTLASEHPEYYSGRYEGRSIGVVTLLDRTVRNQRGDLIILFGATILLLLISTANMNGLFLARALQRSSEIAIRSALGAGKGRIICQLLSETTLFAMTGCTLGIVMAGAGIHILRWFIPPDFPRLSAVSLDSNVLLFAAAIAIMAGLFSMIIPMFVIIRGSSSRAFSIVANQKSRKTTTHLRGLFIIGELALALNLLIGAGLLVHSFRSVRCVEPGVEIESLYVQPLRFPGSYDSVEKFDLFYRAIAEHMKAIPGVESVSWIPDPPMRIGNVSHYIEIEDLGPDADPPLILTHEIGPDYFPTMGIPILSGRDFTPEDNPQNPSDDRNFFNYTPPSVVIIDEIMADQFWPGQNPVGKQLRFQSWPGESWLTVIGIVGRIHQQSLTEDYLPHIYYQSVVTSDETYLLVRTTSTPTEMGSRIRDAVWNADPNLPVPGIQSMSDRLSDDLNTPRFYALMMSSFALTALLLGLAGIFALMLYLVSSQTREIGIYMALGADAKRVLWRVSRQCLLLIGIGTLVGLGVAVATSHLLTGLLFGITPLDLPTYTVAVLMLGMTALLACLVPARRATRVDPTSALRWE